MDRFRGVAGICMKMLPPSSCGMPLVTAASCGFLRDGIEERGEVGVVYEYRSTRDTGDRGGGSRIRLPPPRQPLPHGGDSPIDTVPREETTTSRSHLTLPEILFPPRARLSGLSPCTARPLWRGREEALMSGRAAGVSHEYRSTRDAGDRGGSGQS